MNGSASAPSSATMNGVRWVIRPLDEVDVAAQTIELGDDDRGLELPRRGQGRR